MKPIYILLLTIGVAHFACASRAEEAELLKRVENAFRKASEASKDYQKEDRTTRRKKNFENFSKELADLRAADLLTASRQACKVIRTHPTMSDEEKFVAVTTTVALCLDLYPIKAGENGAEALFLIARDQGEDVYFRRFILSMMEPQSGRISNFIYEHIMKLPLVTAQWLRKIYNDKKETLDVRCAAVIAAHVVLREFYSKVFHKDPKVIEEGRRTGRVVTTTHAFEGNWLLAEETKIALAPIDSEIMAFANDMTMFLDDETCPAEIKRVAANSLEFLVAAHRPLSEIEKLNALMAKYKNKLSEIRSQPTKKEAPTEKKPAGDAVPPAPPAPPGKPAEAPKKD